MGDFHVSIRQAIVNLQKTSKDKRAAVVVRAKIDTVMRYVMRELDIPIPVRGWSRNSLPAPCGMRLGLCQRDLPSNEQ